MVARRIGRSHNSSDNTAVCAELVDRIRANVPRALQELPVWLLWKDEGRRKVPYYTNGSRRRGRLDSPQDRAKLVSFEAAAAALPRVSRASGLGIALGRVPESDVLLSGIDLDHCYADGVLDERVIELMGGVASYAERSPSGAGLHIVGYGDIGTTKSNATGLEIYSRGRYFTMTGCREKHADLADLTETATLARRLYGAGSAKPQQKTDGRGRTSAIGMIYEGGRNDYLSREAFRQHKQGASVEQIEPVLAALNAARCVPPLAADEVHTIAASKGRIRPDALSEPTPLVRPVSPPAAYPLDALGALLAPAARAIAEIVQVPDALAGNTVLATAALAAQAHADVQTLGGARPLSLYVLTVAESGARKSAADDVALAPVREHARRLTLMHRTEVQEWERAAAARKLDRTRARKEAQSGDDYAAALAEITEEPSPRKPWLICSEPTAEGLMRSLADGQYAQGVYTDEGGQIIGGHAMSEEAELRTIAMLSRAWQGSPLDRVRATDREHIVLYGRRVSMHLLAQPEVAARMLGRPLYRSQGYLARWLIAAPESLAGTRMHDPTRPAPGDDGRIRKYSHAVGQLLERTPVEDHEVDGLSPRVLALSAEARALLVSAYDRMEHEQRGGGALDSARDWAAKAAEHACRIAGVLTLINDTDAIHISAEAMSGALALTEHYLGEYMRLVGVAAIPEHIREAQLLLEWLRRKRRASITARYVMQYGPGSIRSGEAARRALSTLTEHGWLTSEDGRTYTVHPALLAEPFP